MHFRGRVSRHLRGVLRAAKPGGAADEALQLIDDSGQSRRRRPQLGGVAAAGRHRDRGMVRREVAPGVSLFRSSVIAGSTTTSLFTEFAM